MQWSIGILLIGLAALFYVLYNRGYLPVKSISAVYLIGSMGAGTNQCSATFRSANGQIKRVLRFKESKSYEFTYKGNISEGEVTAFVLDRNQIVELALNNNCPTGSVQAVNGQRYYLLIGFNNAKGSYSLKWE